MSNDSKRQRLFLTCFVVVVSACILVIIGEYMQQNLSFYWKVYNFAGEGFANFLLGHASDLAGPIGASWISGTYIISTESFVDEDILIRSIQTGTITVSVLFITLETSHPVVDILDIIAFSVPIITMLIYKLLTYNMLKR